MAGEPEDDGRPTVLVVDDDPASADRHGEWLAGRYDARTVHEGEVAVETLRGDPDAIDAVLLSRRTSELPDDPVLATARDAGFDCPVALVTDGRPDAVDGGFDDYLREPVSEEVLLGSVRSLLSVEGQETLRRELSAERVRRNVLRLERSEDELATSDEFARLERDVERLERRLSLHTERPGREDRRPNAVGT